MAAGARLVHLGVVLTAAWLLACREPEGPPRLPPPPPAANARLLGRWVMLPEDKRRRELQVLEAALAGDTLDDLTAEEQAAYEAARHAKGARRAALRDDLRYAAHRVFSFDEQQVTLEFADERYGPVPYTIEESSPSRVVVLFDPGLGHGIERHQLDWQSATRAFDTIDCELPCNVEALIAVREGAPASP